MHGEKKAHRENPIYFGINPHLILRFVPSQPYIVLSTVTSLVSFGIALSNYVAFHNETRDGHTLVMVGTLLAFLINIKHIKSSSLSPYGRMYMK